MKNLLASATSFITKIVSGGPNTQPETLDISQIPTFAGNCQSGPSCSISGSQSIHNSWQEQPVQSQQSAPSAIHDSDGISPGTDMDLTGREFAMRFYGHFYATPQFKSVELVRPVTILFASSKVYVAYDLQMHNIYVVLREDNISQGCGMMTELLPLPENFKATMKILEE